jgi:hypothetical protein
MLLLAAQPSSDGGRSRREQRMSIALVVASHRDVPERRN